MKQKGICAAGLGGQSVFLTVDHFHRPGETVHARSVYTEYGGKAFNQAVAAARLGAEVTFIGAVGNDADGKGCRDFLESENITPVLSCAENASTAYACILTDRAGDNQVTVCRGAADCLSAEFIRSNSALFRAFGAVLVGFECPLEATLAVMEEARRAGAYVILNPAPARRVDISVLRAADIITPNLQEAQTLFGIESSEPDRLCAAMSAAGIKCAVVTLGSKGALLLNGGRGYSFPAVPRRAVDTTGAGDCFNGALAAALMDGKDIFQAVGYGINASSLSVTRSHVMTALPTAAELEAAYIPLAGELIWQQVRS